MFKKLFFIVLFFTSLNSFAQECQLSGVTFGDLNAEQTNALISVGAACPTGNESASLPDFNNEKMTSLCTEKWSKRGVLDNNMFNYCMNRKTDSYGDLNYLLSQSSDIPGLNNILQYGINEWFESDGWDMVLYEVNQQKEGYLDVEYLMANGGSEQQLQSCKDQWLTYNEPNWRMVLYCLEK